MRSSGERITSGAGVGRGSAMQSAVGRDRASAERACGARARPMGQAPHRPRPTPGLKGRRPEGPVFRHGRSQESGHGTVLSGQRCPSLTSHPFTWPSPATLWRSHSPLRVSCDNAPVAGAR